MERSESCANIRYSYPLSWEHYSSRPELDFAAWLIAIDHNPLIALLTWSLPRTKTPRRIAFVINGHLARACARLWTAKRYPRTQVEVFADEGKAREWLSEMERQRGGS